LDKTTSLVKSGFWKHRLILTVLLLSSFLPMFVNVHGQETSSQLPSVLVYPDNWLYGLKRGLYEPSQAAFSISDDSKATTYLSQASARIVELQAMHAKNQLQYDNDLVSDYQNKMEAATSALDKIQDNATHTRIAAQVVSETSQHIIVLQRVLANAPPQAHQGLINAISKSQNGQLHAAQNYADHHPSSQVTVAQVSCTAQAGKASCSTAITTVTPKHR